MRPLNALACLVLAAVTAAPAVAQDYPNRPIKLVVPFGGGGAIDPIGRLVAGAMEKTLGQSVVVDNRPGAGGIVGTVAVANAAPDGYTLLMISSAFPSTLAVRRTSPVRVDQIESISVVAQTPLALSRAPGAPYNSIAELVAFAKARPGQVNFGANGLGSTSHLLGEKFAIEANIKMVPVLFGGAAQSWMALLGNQIQVVVDNLPSSIAHTRDGKARILAVSSAQRSSMVPDIPTFKELGLTQVSTAGWYGIGAPAGTPPAILQRLEAAIIEAGKSAELRQKLSAMGADPLFTGRAEANARVRDDFQYWVDISNRLGLKID